MMSTAFMEKIKTFLKQFPRHWVVAGSAWGSKIITSVVQILSIRSLLSYLGEDRYAVYAIAFSISGWISISESGIGISLQNYISACRAKQISYDKYLLAALQLTVVLFIFFLLILLIVADPLQNVLFRKFTYIDGLSGSHIIAIVGVIMLLSAFTSIAYRICYSQHKGYISNILPAVASVISMILIVLVNKFCSFGERSILLVLLIFTVPQFLCVSIPFINIFKKVASKFFQFDKTAITEIMTRAMKFHGIAILSIIFVQTDYIIMSQTVQSVDIVTYNIFMKVFLFLTFIYSSLLTASWPLFSEMYVKREFSKIKAMLKKYLLLGSVFYILGTLAIYIFSEPIVKILAPDINITPSLRLISLFGLYVLIAGWVLTLTSVLQSANIIRVFWKYMPFQVVLNILLQYFLSQRCGIEGILLGLIISMLLTAFWILAFKTSKVLKENVI